MVNNCSYKEFLDKIFPSIDELLQTPDVSYQTNNTIQIHMLVYGKQGSGKTELARAIAEYLNEKYGSHNVSTVWTEGDLASLIQHGIKNTLVNFLVCEDITLEKISRDTIRDFFRIRHIYAERTGRRNGLIVTLVTVHRFHGLKYPELRTDVDVIFIKNIPTNPYDESIIRKYTTPRLLNELRKYEQIRDKHPTLKGYCLVYHKGNKFMTYFPLAKQDYLSLLQLPKLIVRIQVNRTVNKGLSDYALDVLAGLGALLYSGMFFVSILVFFLVLWGVLIG